MTDEKIVKAEQKLYEKASKIADKYNLKQLKMLCSRDRTFKYPATKGQETANRKATVNSMALLIKIGL